MVIDKAGAAIIDYDSGLGEVLTELPGQPVGNSMAYTGPLGPSCIEKFDSYAEFSLLSAALAADAQACRARIA